MGEQIRGLQLNDGEHLASRLYRLEKGSILQFGLGPSLQAHDVHIFVNYPPNGSQKPFDRKVFYELEWKSPDNQSYDRTDRFCEIQLLLAGSFQYYFTYDNSNTEQGSGYFQVDPTLMISPDCMIPFDCITLETFLSKCLGPFSEWERRLLVAKETGYNMIHFTPIQELGASNSCYSLRNQLALNPLFGDISFDDVQNFVKRWQTEFGVLSICDVVWNHTSFDSPWLKEHPECAYNVKNSPHLRPAYVLDRILWHTTLDVIAGKWEHMGVSKIIDKEDHLAKLQDVVSNHVLPKYKLEQFYQIDVNATVEEFQRLVQASGTVHPAHDSAPWKVQLVQDKDYKRLGCSVNMDEALIHFNISRELAEDEEERLEKCCSAFKHHLEELNHHAHLAMNEDLKHAVNNMVANVRYYHLEQHGPRLKEVTKENPLVKCYFRGYGPTTDIESEEAFMDSDKAPLLMASNGWVMGDDPLKNFAEPSSKVYLRRELINWGDSIKLRYGDKPEDCPYLWNHMLEYTRIVARVFHGFRIDNCHSTPIHVAEYLLDEARRVRPDLYVIAELFTSSEDIDNIFVNRLGINSLIREAMSAGDAHEEGRLVYRYGGEPVGSFMQPPKRPLTPSIAHALLMDATHDNRCPVEVRSVYDPLPSTALVCMASCATGTTKGFDELVPHQIHVVKDNRLYRSWNPEAPSNSETEVNMVSGIHAAKAALNKLHHVLGGGGYNQVYVDQLDENIIAVTRHCPGSHKSVILVARTSFKHPGNPNYTGHIAPLCVPGQVEEIILEARLIQKGEEEYVKSKTHINGLTTFKVDMREHIQLFGSKMVELHHHDDNEREPIQELDFVSFPPGSIIAFKVSLLPAARAALSSLRSCLNQFGYRVRTLSGNPTQNNTSSFYTIASKLTLSDMNRILYRCSAEEESDGKGVSGYHVPNFGDLVYCGLQGFMSVLSEIRLKNDLGHPLCDNLRQGDWMFEYIANRLKLHTSTRAMGKWFEVAFAPLRCIPRYLIPCYFDALVTGAYRALLDITWDSMSSFVTKGSTFVRALALGSVQMCGQVRNAPLPELSPKLDGVPLIFNEDSGKNIQGTVTMAAGLPHFAAGFMRSWGRDTFIALPGLLLVTGRYEDAKFLILAFAGTLRHGLIPNLLGGGEHSRYNCRDATWFWLYCIQLYTQCVEDGVSILQCPVSRLYPTDDCDPQPAGFVEQPLYDVIQEALQRHVEGIGYREKHAGPGLDKNMSDEGFNVTVGVDFETGFPFGGSEKNCGTWMDKMGESNIAGTRGKPATPRDGSPVEIVGLCKAAVRWLVQMNSEGHYPYDSVSAHDEGKTFRLTFTEWNQKILNNFESKFWVPPDICKKTNKLVNRAGIYKDSVGASQFWADFQLRCNFPIAMVVAPELFTASNAWKALSMAEEFLLGPLGMKTLDPSDWAYDGNYNNSYDGPDAKIARGFNYHQGPEWVWPVGYFLRAKLHFSRLVADPAETFESTVQFVHKTLARHHQEIITSPWRGLPELTNKDGTPCHDGCPTQAWSMACLLEVMHDLYKLLKN